MTADDATGPTPDEGVEAFLEALRARGLRVTASRRVMVSVLVQHRGHATAEDLIAAVQRIAPDLSPSTVYRFLDTLSELGLAHHSHFARGPAVHHITTDEHVHLYCDRCGALVEIERARFQQLTSAVKRTYGFEMRPTHFAVEGRCSVCLGADAGVPGGSAVGAKSNCDRQSS